MDEIPKWRIIIGGIGVLMILGTNKIQWKLLGIGLFAMANWIPYKKKKYKF